MLAVICSSFWLVGDSASRLIWVFDRRALGSLADVDRVYSLAVLEVSLIRVSASLIGSGRRVASRTGMAGGNRLSQAHVVGIRPPSTTS